MALVCVARYADVAEAEVARSALDSAGVFALVFDGDFSQAAWHLSTAIGGVRLMVAEEQLADAQAVLALPEPAQKPSDDEETCPRCGAIDIARMYSWWSLAPSALIGSVFLFRRLRRHCRACGHDWRVDRDARSMRAEP
jgi:hypothetical protein